MPNFIIVDVDSVPRRYDSIVLRHISVANSYRTYEIEARITAYSLSRWDELLRPNKYRVKPNADLASVHDAASVILRFLFRYQ